MKKILLSMPSYASFYPPMRASFEKLGIEVYHFDYRHGNLAAKVIRQIRGHKVAQRYIENAMVNLIKSHEIRVFLVVKGEVLSEDFLKKLRKNGITTVNYFPDPMNYWDFMINNVPNYDYFIHFDPMIVRRLRLKGYKNVHYLPCASEIQPFEDTIKQYDISFVGTYSEFREKYLSVCKHLNLNIWGDPRWLTSGLKKFARGGRVTQQEMKRIIKRSKVNINIHYNAPKEGTNLRTFEVTGSAGFLLVEYVKDLPKLFKINKEIVTFRTPVEMAKKAKEYLSNDLLRNKIALAGYQRALQDHNYDIRIKQLLEILK